MQFFTLIALAGAASAAAIVGRDNPVGNFSISDFSYQAEPHSVEATMDFNIDSIHGSGPVSCINSTSTSPSLGPIYRSHCNVTSFTFSFLPGTLNGHKGSFLAINDTLKFASGNKALLSGRKFFPAKDVKTFESPPGSGSEYEYIAHKRNFKIAFVESAK